MSCYTSWYTLLLCECRQKWRNVLQVNGPIGLSVQWRVGWASSTAKGCSSTRWWQKICVTYPWRRQTTVSVWRTPVGMTSAVSIATDKKDVDGAPTGRRTRRSLKCGMMRPRTPTTHVPWPHGQTGPHVVYPVVKACTRGSECSCTNLGLATALSPAWRRKSAWPLWWTATKQQWWKTSQVFVELLFVYLFIDLFIQLFDWCFMMPVCCLYYLLVVWSVSLLLKFYLIIKTNM